MKPRVRNVIMWTACAAAIALAACTKVLETTPMHVGALGFGPTCHTPFGAYYLPKTLLKLSAEVKGKSIEVTYHDPVKTADRTQPLCLDYLGSLTSDDVVRIRRSPNGLLEGVTSHVVDRTPEIVEKLVEAGANFAIAAAREIIEQSDDTIHVEFDPFHWPDMMTAKSGLRRFGVCVYVEGYTFPIHGMSPAQIRAAAERWCSNYHPRPYDDGSVFYSSLPVPPEVMQTGILYRPNVAHKVVIMRKFDPYGPERWQPFQTVMVGMPNLGPILSIGVERALFATRDTDLVFNQGVLTDVSIDKKSELVGFVRIPLAVAKAVVGVPAQILQIRIADTRNQTALLNAQGELANTLSKIRQDNAKGAGDALGTRSAVSREGQFVGSCMNAGGDPESCQRLARPTQ